MLTGERLESEDWADAERQRSRALMMDIGLVIEDNSQQNRKKKATYKLIFIVYINDC
jgi:hypothetical protein